MASNNLDLTNAQLVYALDQCFNGVDNLFIQARAGCGKSTIIKLIMKNMKNVVTLSTTGSSASDLASENIPAYTIHSFFKIKPVPIFDSEDITTNIGKNLSVLKKAKIIIIDEVSMMTNQLFDFVLNKMNYLLGTNKYEFPRLILFGDILQLPPVVDAKNVAVADYYNKTYNGNVMFFNSNAYNKLDFKTLTLSKSYRQKDPIFANAIRRVSIGDIDQNLLNYFNQRVMPEKEFADNFSTYMYLTIANKNVDQRNKEYIESLPGEVYKFESSYYGKVDKKSIPKTKELKIGGQAMILLNNYGSTEEYVYSNGMCGKIIDIDYDEDDVTKSSITLDVPKHGIKIIKYHKTKVMEPVVVNNKVTYDEVGTYVHMPCVACKAITVHKSQGKTLNASYIDLGNWVPESLTYVALSRAESLESIGLSRPLNFGDFKVNQESRDYIISSSNFVEYAN